MLFYEDKPLSDSSLLKIRKSLQFDCFLPSGYLLVVDLLVDFYFLSLGLKGDRGDQGGAGIKGIKGLRGNPALSGLVGPKGYKGLPGPKGRSGEKRKYTSTVLK